MDKKLVAMAWDMKKLRAEIANAEERAWAVATAGNPGQGYNANYGNVDAGYAGNPYPYNIAWYSLDWRIFLRVDLGLLLGAHMTCSELKDTGFLLSNLITGILGCSLFRVLRVIYS
ncbi:hypothetical protein JHK87_047477 [Glycine soja]|nr:hypothetical protein JHK87_047477 [Glycine soja]